MANKNYNDVMGILRQVPKVNEHLNKISVIMGKKILKRRLELGLTQKEVVSMIKDHGDTFTQATLSKIESGADNIKSETYDKVFVALGGLEDLTPKFKENPKGKDLIHS
ncbi:helix-turn-helix domain-containing protein [Planococcus kocurii]|uniref:helix-turn-helix domain-containing protein n=1 Tax=Planococcus TaxID=1372 RepID=UPI0011EBB9BC|nr:helix-turn-helix transcriptional regulator [Planococcus sp. ANT_H30]KAA0958136.1 helix-turn-helix transcriptional regulator [Planococcus sp. ANT_H30]